MPSRSIAKRVTPSVEISSMPSFPHTMSALREPRRSSVSANVRRSAGSATPITCCFTPAGLVSGPR